MRPVYLSMTAFGPYLKKQEIPFEPLNRCQIFLISGPTGGGKTSILDAMSFALFGEATGGQRSFIEMRANAAPEDLDTEVSFAFSLGKEEYRFDRRIHPHRKRDGSIDMRIEASCSQREDGGWRPLESSSPKAVSKKAEELLGLTYQQFAQMTVLPQGEFRKLLLASSAEKEKILEKLFHTRRWNQISDTVAAMASKQEKELEKFLAERAAVLRQQEAEDLTAFYKKVQQQATMAEQAQKEAEAAGAAYQAAERAWNRARQAAEAREKWEKAKEAFQRLTQQRGEMDGLSARLEQARLVQAVQPFYQSHCRDRRLARQREQELAQANAALQARQKRAAMLPDYQKELDKAQREKEEAIRESSILQPLLEQAGQLETWKQKAQTLQQKVEQCKRAEEQAQENAAQAGEALNRAEEQAKKLQAELERLPELETALQQCKERREEFNSLDSAAKSVEQAKIQLAGEKEKEKRIRTRLAVFQQQADALEAELRRHTAAQLAIGLEEGAPCPVCGAVHHLALAQPPEGVCRPEQLELMREEAGREAREAERMAKAVFQAEAMAQSAELLFQTVQRRCARFLTGREENQEELARVAAEIERINASVRERRKVQKQVEQAQELRQAAEEALERARQERLYAEIAFAEANGQVQAMEGRLPKEKAVALYEKAETLKVRTRALQHSIQEQQERIHKIATEEVQARERFFAAQAAYLTAEQEAQSSLELWEREASARGLDLERFLQAQEKEQPLEQWEEQLRQFHTAWQYWKKQEEQLRMEASAQPAPDLARAEKNYQAAQAAKTTADERLGEERARLAQLETLQARLNELEKNSGALEEQAGRLQKLSRLLSGKNSRKTPLHQFVLGLMLDDILQSSNQYLDQLSGGRYQMARKSGEIAGGGYKGLELEICDGYQGGNRPVGTLSGGEMFLASLSLAFGLADVVQRGAGGIRLDSIFIDEGFGTLDRETREAVMQSLAQIRASGRVVGLISHVEELRDVIPARIEVSRNRDGGSFVSVFCQEQPV